MSGAARHTNELQPGYTSPLLYVANGDGTISAYSVEAGASATTGMLTPIAIPAVAHGTTPAAMASEWAGDMGRRPMTLGYPREAPMRGEN